MSSDSGLLELVNAFASEKDISNVARSSVEFLAKSGDRDEAHRRLCYAMIRRTEGGNADLSTLLHFAGDVQLLEVVYTNISHTK